MIKTKKEPINKIVILFKIVILSGVVSVFIAIITMPSFFGQPTHTALEGEAKITLGAVGRGSQAFYLEKQSFTASIDDLGLGLYTDTENYSYQTIASDNLTSYVAFAALPKVEGIQGFSVGIAKYNPSDDDLNTTTIICEGTTSPPIYKPNSSRSEDALSCNGGTQLD